MKYTQKGGVTFSVELTKREKKDVVYLRFAVKDTGIGIKKEDLSRLGKSFERIDLEHNRNIEGTGLGTSIACDLLHMMDSGLEVESEYGVGSTFSFVLRQEIIKNEPVGNYKSRINSMKEDYTYQCQFMAPDAKVLVVDDNDINRMVFRSLVKHTRIQVTDVGSGRECLGLVEKEHFDIIFLDHMMPEMDGIETLNHIKAMEDCKCKNTPVIVLTANAVAGAREKYMEEGFNAYISKPIDAGKLEEVIKEYLPEQLVMAYAECDEVKEDTEILPEIEGINWDYAHLFVKDDETLMFTLSNIYKAMPSDKAELDRLYMALDEEEGIANYRIKIHAMKSTNASVGATTVAAIARYLEERAIAGDVEAIRSVHPAFMAEFGRYEERLSQIFATKENNVANSGELTDMGHVKKLLNDFITALDSFDYDEADRLIEELRRCNCDDSINQAIKELEILEFNLDFQKCFENANALLNTL